MAYAAMKCLNGQVIFGTIGQADQNPATVTTMLNNCPNDNVCHLFEFQVNDATGAVVSATMDKNPLTVT